MMVVRRRRRRSQIRDIHYCVNTITNCRDLDVLAVGTNGKGHLGNGAFVGYSNEPQTVFRRRLDADRLTPPPIGDGETGSQ
jgi:hypothetical protein